MKKLFTYVIFLACIYIPVFGIYMLVSAQGITHDSVSPPTRPYNVYQSGNYCVYIASNQAGIAMQVVSNYGATCQ